MKVSYNWLSNYVNHDLDPEQLGHWMTSLGLEVEGMERYESIKGALEGVVTGEIKSCYKHPNADKLSLTEVDVGKEELLHIVCGAPNVAEGQKVLVATVGTTLYDGDGKPWKIKKAKIRGERSEGMICAEDELGLGSSHDGIMVLDPDTEIGQSASTLFPVEADVVYDIGLTPNRSDATAHLGVARDVLAALRVRAHRQEQLHMPELADIKVSGNHEAIEVRVENPNLCPRFSMLLLKNVQVGPSPDWLKHRLEAIGVRSINNVVDVTNYVLHEYGQPLHAYDYDLLQEGTIVVDTLSGDTTFTALDEVERKMHASDLMICDKDRKPIGIAGVFGGASTGVSSRTRSVLLEAAHFNAISVRRTSTRHNLRTEAAKCFEKGSDPEKTIEALRRAAHLLMAHANAEIEGNILDVYPKKVDPVEVALAYDYVERMTGNKLSPEEIVKILRAMEMEVMDDNGNRALVRVPSDKADVTRPADLLEEVLRVYGYDNIIPDQKLHQTLIPTDGLEMYEFREMLAEYLSSSGFLQMMNLSLSQSRFYDEGRKDLVRVLNTSNVHLDIMRPDMLISGLEAVAFNHNRRQTDLKLYELGKTYNASDGAFNEQDRLALYLTGKWEQEHWSMESKDSDFYTLKGVVSALLQRFGIEDVVGHPTEDERFAYGLDLTSGKRALGVCGLISNEARKPFDIDVDVFAADLSVENMFKLFTDQQVRYQAINKYPGTRRDIAVVIDQGVHYKDLEVIIFSKGKKLIKQVNLFDVYESAEQLGEGKKSYAISMVFEHPEKTLTDKEVDITVDKILRALKESHGATLR